MPFVFTMRSGASFTVANGGSLHPAEPFPSRKIVENRQRLCVWSLQRASALTPGAVTTLSIERHPVAYLRAEAGPRLWVGETEVQLTFDMPMANVPRYWFECPGCSKRCRHLYLPELRCRTCLGMDYACRHAGREYRRRSASWLDKVVDRQERRMLAETRRFAEKAERELLRWTSTQKTSSTPQSQD